MKEKIFTRNGGQSQNKLKNCSETAQLLSSWTRWASPRNWELLLLRQPLLNEKKVRGLPVSIAIRNTNGLQSQCSGAATLLLARSVLISFHTNSTNTKTLHTRSSYSHNSLLLQLALLREANQTYDKNARSPQTAYSLLFLYNARDQNFSGSSRSCFPPTELSFSSTLLERSQTVSEV